jgi:hypothetical protein
MNDHHVAWADRLGFNKRWSNIMDECSKAHGTDEYVNQVDRLKNDIINIKDGPTLSDTIEDYYRTIISTMGNTLYDEWVYRNQQEARIEESVSDVKERIRLFQAEKLYKFICQTLENNGFGFYKSSIEMEENKM